LTSSIYPILDSLSAPIITIAGSGYTTTPTVTIDPPSSGTQATGIAVISNDVINAISGITGGTGYTTGEEVTLAGDVSGIGATGIATISAGAVQSILFTSRGSGFSISETVTITGVSSTQSDAEFDVTSIADNAVSSITITDGGTGYTSLPLITITGGGGTGATATAVFNVKSGVIAADTNILNSPISIIPINVKPGGGGIVRLMFSLNTSATTNIKIFNNGNLKGLLNADNTNNIESDGYYRFDLDVESGDNLNFQSTQSINAVNFTRAHLVQFGA